MTDPVFILAPPRTLSDRVSAMLGVHDAMFALPDVNLFATDSLKGMSHWYQQNPRLQKGLLFAVAQLGFGGHDKAQLEQAKGWLRSRLETDTLQIFRQLQDWAAPRTLLDRSVLNLSATALQRMAKAFPDAHFLHLLQSPWRHLGRFSTTEPAATIMEQTWLRPHLTILEFLEGVDDSRQLAIRVEDLFADPGLYLPQLLDWLGLEADADIVAGMQTPEPGIVEKTTLEPGVWQAGEAVEDVQADMPDSLGIEISHYARLFGYT